MGKNENGFDKKSIMAKQRELEKELIKLRIPCSHTKANGKLTVEFEGETYVRCKRCNAKFDFAQISREDLERAIKTVHNAINQIKAFTNGPEEDQKIIKMLGEMDYRLGELSKLYSTALSENAKNKNGKKKKKHNNDFGTYGLNSLAFNSRR